MTGTQGLKSEVAEKLLNEISSTKAEGSTALYDAVERAYRILEERRKTHQGDARRYGIVVLSDGNDKDSEFTLAKLEAMMRPTWKDPTNIQIHTIGIGEDADEKALKRIATASQGRYWNPDISLLEAIYRHIIEYF